MSTFALRFADGRAVPDVVAPRTWVNGRFELDEPPAGRIELVIEATPVGAEGSGAEPADEAPLRWRQEVGASRVMHLEGVTVPRQAGRYRFRGALQQLGPGSEDAEPEAIGEVELQVGTGRARLRGTAFLDPPNIFGVLQRMRPRGEGEGVEGVFEHVLAGVGQHETLYQEVFSQPDYRVEGETDGDGNPVEELAEWQRQTVFYLSGSFYWTVARRNLQCLNAEVGYYLVGVCNNLADTVGWLRGLPFPTDGVDVVNGDSTGQNVGLNCTESKTIEVLRRALALYREQAGVSDDEQDPAVAGFVHDFTQAAVSPTPEQSFQQARPGSIVAWEGHIAVVLRVQERAGNPRSRRIQLFDTGAASATGNVPPGLHVRSKALQESDWLPPPPRAGHEPSFPHVPGHGDLLVHAYIPLVRRDPPFKPRPLYQPLEQVYRVVVDEQGAAVRVRDRRDHPPTRAARLLEDAQSPPVHLAITEGDTLHYLSGPLRTGVPLTTLFYSVAKPPQSDRFQARWFALLWYDWDDLIMRYEHASDATCPVRRCRHANHADRSCTVIVERERRRDGVRTTEREECGCRYGTSVVVELYNSPDGTARLFRPMHDSQQRLPSEFTSRLAELLSRPSRRVFEGDQEREWRRPDWDRRLQAALGGAAGGLLEGPPARGARRR